jgi:hypothetical protein
LASCSFFFITILASVSFFFLCSLIRSILLSRLSVDGDFSGWGSKEEKM